MGTTRTCDARPLDASERAVPESPETETLIACTRVDAAAEDVVTSLRRVDDWRLLENLALRHAVLPLAYAAAEKAGADLPRAADDLRRTAVAICERSFRLSASLVNILA